MIKINPILALSKREFLIMFRNFSNTITIFLFFLLGIVIFVFSVEPNKEIFDQIGIGIIWTLLLLSNTLCMKIFFQDDFDNDNIIILHFGGLSYEFIAIIKIVFIWIFIQIPFFLIVTLGTYLLNINNINTKMMFLSFVIGSIIITCITSISGSMNLLNKKNFSIGSLIVMLLSIPVIIFCAGIMRGTESLIYAQIKILLGIMFFFFAITPWVCGMCIKISIQNK